MWPKSDKRKTNARVHAELVRRIFTYIKYTTGGCEIARNATWAYLYTRGRIGTSSTPA